jgi:hypothetical protein
MIRRVLLAALLATLALAEASQAQEAPRPQRQEPQPRPGEGVPTAPVPQRPEGLAAPEPPPPAPRPERAPSEPARPDRSEPDTPQQSRPAMPPTGDLRRARVEVGCLRPGGALGLSAAGPRRETVARLRALEGQGGAVALQRVGIGGSFAVPRDALLDTGATYAVEVSDDERTWRRFGQRLEVCPQTAALGAGERPADLLAVLRVGGTEALGPIVRTPVADVLAQLARDGLALRERLDLPALQLVLLRLAAPAGADVDALLARLRADFPDISFDTNALFAASSGRRYAREMLGFGEACAVPQGNRSAIGLLDGPVAWDHPKLGTVERLGEWFPAARRPPGDHGTALAGLLSETMPGVRLLAAAAFTETGTGSSASTRDLVAGLDWLAAAGAELVLLAWEGPRNAALETSLLAAADAGMMFVAAAGNGGGESPVAYPAASRWTFAVTAVDAAGSVYAKASQGPEVAFSAPGVEVWAPAADGGERYFSGTSFAVPYAAALLAAELEAGGRGTRAGIAAVTARAGLLGRLAANARDLGEPGRDPVYGWGLPRVRCRRRVSARRRRCGRSGAAR